MHTNEKPLEWIGSSHKDLMAMPTEVRRFFGFALSLAQAGDKHEAAKVLRGFGGAGVLEVVEDDADGTYRAVYTVKFSQAVPAWAMTLKSPFAPPNLTWATSYSAPHSAMNQTPVDLGGSYFY
jgi:phage-related protein